MAKLPIISGKDLIKFLASKGFQTISQKGSHIRMKKFGERVLVTVIPLHKRLDPGTLLGILKQTETTREELEAFLRK